MKAKQMGEIFKNEKGLRHKGVSNMFERYLKIWIEISHEVNTFWEFKKVVAVSPVLSGFSFKMTVEKWNQ